MIRTKEKVSVKPTEESPVIDEDFLVIAEMEETVENDDEYEQMTDDPDALDLFHDHEDDPLMEEESPLLWVSNLNRSVTDRHLKMAFNISDVVSVKIVEIDLGSFKKYYALVKMTQVEKAKNIVAKFHQKSLMGNKVDVEQVLEEPNLEGLKEHGLS